MTGSWICTRCGGGACSVLDGHPSLDDRFAIGWCDRCTPLPTLDPRRPHDQKKRGTIVLARDSDQVREEIARRDQLIRDRKLVEQVFGRSGKVPDGPRGDAMRAEATRIRQRWAAEAAARRSS